MAVVARLEGQAFRHPQKAAKGESRISQTCMAELKQRSVHVFDEGLMNAFTFKTFEF